MRLSALGSALLAFVLLLNAWLALSNVQAVTQAEARIARTQATRLEIEGLLSDMTDAETGQRGFLITGKDSYLEPYRKALHDIDRRLTSISGSINEQPEQHADLHTVRNLVTAKLALVERTIGRLRNDPDPGRGIEAAREMVRSGRGKAVMDELRRVIAVMDERERAELASKQRELDGRWRTAKLTTSLSLGVGLLLLGITVFVMRRQAAAADAARERLRLFIAYAPASLAMFDREMRYLSASQRWLSDYGLGDVSLVGKSHYDVFPEIGDEWRRVHARALAGEVVCADGDRFVRKDGTVHLLRWEVRPWRDSSGKIGGIVIFTEDITELVRAGNEAREMAQWLRVALAAAGAGAWQWNLRTNENVWSEELWKLYGLEPGSCEPSYETWRSAIMPEDRAATEQALQRAAEQGKDLAVEFRVRWKDGSVHHLLGLAQPTPDENGASERYLGIVIDITERKHAEEALRKAEQERALRQASDRLVSAVESIDDALALFDADDRLVLCNRAYRALIGSSLAGSLVGERYETLLEAWSRDMAFANDEERARFREQRLASRGNPTTTFEVRMRDGRSLRVMDRPTPDGGIVKTVWDLTNEKRSAEELRQARIAAEAGSAAKSEFLSSMSHELRTPLNAVLGFAQLLQRDRREPLTERHRERVDQIVRGGEHLLHLIDDVLDLSRIEEGRITISTEPVGVNEVLNEVKATLEPMAARSNIRILITGTAQPLPAVAADRTRFVQILMNLGSNAIKYNVPEGTVTFDVQETPGGRLRVTVRDTGLGIPPATQGLLFQPFQRAGQENGPIEGTGIGLVVTRRLARLMNGEVGFKSAVGEGSEFWVELPTLPGTTIPAHSDARALTQALGDEHHRVLYVEDNPANVALMKDLVGVLTNVELFTAPTAEIGVELARARRPDLVIMDVNLPGSMSGIDALHALQADAETKNIPVIALSAAASARDQQRGLKAGFARYLTKPVNVEELDAALCDLLKHAS